MRLPLIPIMMSTLALAGCATKPPVAPSTRDVGAELATVGGAVSDARTSNAAARDLVLQALSKLP